MTTYRSWPASLFLTAVAALASCGGGRVAFAQDTVFKKLISAATTPMTSATVPQIGQGLHMLAVIFPAASGTVSSIVVRLEASYDNSTFFPITPDITEGIYTGSFSFAMVRGNGNFPYVRARIVTASMSNPMDVWYTGAQHPIGNTFLSGDRFLSAAATGTAKFTFVICNGTPCSPQTEVTNRLIVTDDTTVERCWIAAKSAPVGADLIVDILKNGTTSIFGAGQMHLTAGQSGPQQTATFTSPALQAGTYLTLSITQVGTTDPGQDVTVACRAVF